MLHLMMVPFTVSPPPSLNLTLETSQNHHLCHIDHIIIVASTTRILPCNDRSGEWSNAIVEHRFEFVRTTLIVFSVKSLAALRFVISCWYQSNAKCERKEGWKNLTKDVNWDLCWCYKEDEHKMHQKRHDERTKRTRQDSWERLRQKKTLMQR